MDYQKNNSAMRQSSVLMSSINNQTQRYCACVTVFVGQVRFTAVIVTTTDCRVTANSKSEILLRSPLQLLINFPFHRFKNNFI